MDTQLSPLVENLIARQAAEGLSSKEFADRLGISDAYWCLIRTGKRGVGAKLILATLRLYGQNAIPSEIANEKAERAS